MAVTSTTCALIVRVRNGVGQVEEEGLLVIVVEPFLGFCMDGENAGMIGADPKLCLHKFARAVDGGREFFLMYMVDPDNSGLRCISLPD